MQGLRTLKDSVSGRNVVSDNELLGKQPTTVELGAKQHKACLSNERKCY